MRNTSGDVDAAHPFELALAPTALLCKLLIDFAFDELGWLISVVPTSFKAQHDQLWANGKFDLDYLARRVLAWTALYLSLLSYALVYVRESCAAEWGVAPGHKWPLVPSCLKAAAVLQGPI